MHKSISENLFSLYQQFFIPASTLGRQGHDCEGLHNHFLWSLHQMKYINLLLHFFRQKDTNYCNFSFSRIFHNFKYCYFYLQTQLCQSDCWGIVRWLYKAISEHRISGSVWKMEWFTKESPALCARQRQIV